MADLFRRQWSIQVGTVRVEGIGAGPGGARTGLDCSFEIERSTRREPNKASVRIWNLAPEHRAALERTRALPVTVAAGYAGAVSTLFDGDVRVAESRRRQAAHRSAVSAHGRLAGTTDDVDYMTEIEAEDGGTAWRTATVSRSFGPGTPVSAVLAAAVDAMRIGRGNLGEIGTLALGDGDLGAYSEGTTLSGQAHRELDRVVRSCGLTWSVQSGALQLRRAGRALATTATMLSSSTGLVGSPSVDADGYVEAVSLLNGALYPGRPVVLSSRHLEGSFQVRRVRHVGDTTGSEWYSEVTLEER